MTATQPASLPKFENASSNEGYGDNYNSISDTHTLLSNSNNF